ncbi:MAG: HYR domain-containing protein [Lewinellaceae bacterium]|nr:HYR domain-containing protein [Lewinellaceae bacterium]
MYGELGLGGAVPDNCFNTLCGGGGGYYGGGCGNNGGGGSSYIDGVIGGFTTPGVQAGNGLVKITYDVVGLMQVAGLPSGSLFPVGSTTNVFVVSDASGNTASCSFNVTVTDEEDPTIVCPDNVSITTSNLGTLGDCAGQYAWSHPTPTDNCGIADLDFTYTNPDGTIDGPFDGVQISNGTITTDANHDFAVGTTTVSYYVQDIHGNTTTCAFTVTVTDDEDPTFVNCPDDFTVSTDVDLCGAHVVFSTPLASDNCEVDVTHTSGLFSGDLFPLGASTVVFTATDGAANSVTCEVIITVEDDQTPTAVCQDITIYLDADGLASITPADVDGGSTDNCEVESLEIDIAEFDCDNTGDNNVTLTVYDPAENSSICVATVTVLDTIAPTFTCPDAITLPSCSSLVPDVISDIDDADDNCLVASITQDPVAGLDFGAMNGNTVDVTVTVTDASGNTTTCVVVVTITDTNNPVFVNCPTSMIMIGNDPDECSGKVNWQPPVALDDCLPIPLGAAGNPLPGTIVQIGGPLPGSIVPITCPPTPTTITYQATDASGNTAICSFDIMVVDTQDPEFDADITMPNDTTVNCHQVPSNCVYHGNGICTPLTNNDVHDNCTVPADLDVNYEQLSTQDPDPNVCGHYDYNLTRIWTISDCAGNQLVHTQLIEVQDTTKPVAVCKNITITLDPFGNASIVPTDIDGGSTDNCAAFENLTFTASQLQFNCLHLGDNEVTLTVTDPCGNFSTCIAIVTVVEGIGKCEPEYDYDGSDPCVCLDNATNLENGQFSELIQIWALGGQTWTIISSTGLYTANSPNPPAAPTPVANGTLFLNGTVDGLDNNGNGVIDEASEVVYYTFNARHVEAIGYTATFQNDKGQILVLSNKCYYPTPFFVNLDGPFCLSTPPFQIEVGEVNNATGNVINMTVDGIPTTTFNAGALGAGQHMVMATFDAGTATPNIVVNGVQIGGSMQDALEDPGCLQKISTFVNIVGTPTTVACNDTIQVSLDASCMAIINPDMVLEGTYFCYDDYTVVLNYPNGTQTYTPPNKVDASHINKYIPFTLVHYISGNMCWGVIKVEDKLKPSLTCPPDITIACSESTGVAHTGNVGIQDCSPTTTQIDNVIVDNGECGDPRQVITRTFIVTDASNNQSLCTQTITVVPFDLTDVVFPADITINCEDAYLNPAATQPGNTGQPSINGAAIGAGGLCSASINYSDEIYDICAGSYEILRTWKIRNTCFSVGPNNPIEHTQIIRLKDFGGPVFACPGDVTVSVDPLNPNCCATAALPDMIITEGCSLIEDLEAKVTGVDPNTGNITTFTVAGYLGDFPGNNYWNPDTLAIFPYTQCLPNNNIYTVQYTAADQCGNISSCNFTLTVADLAPPVAACDEFTKVALGGSGESYVDASTFDDGSYDNCHAVSFKARRMNDNSCDPNDMFDDQVKFCCSDIGDTIQVIFRVYDVDVATGEVGLDAYEPHFNDCMVQVFVEDKIKPVCQAPANVTVSCENFDPSLWSYGNATPQDNCCLDTTKVYQGQVGLTHAVNYSQFDTLCNKGTIVRTFRAYDCAGNSSQCTQRIVVNYEQDYYIKFPNDVIVTTCNGSGIYGEPTFFGEDCELLAVSHQDEIFTVVPDACFKIERTWDIINWCTYNTNLPLIDVPNPNPNATSNHPSNLPGPIVSAPGTLAPWAPTVVAITRAHCQRTTRRSGAPTPTATATSRSSRS